jgi:hypothetical protein
MEIHVFYAIIVIVGNVQQIIIATIVILDINCIKGNVYNVI